jgi:hypothetical protein
MMDDLRQAFRSLRKQWTFAAVAIVKPVQRLLGEMDSDRPVFNARTIDTHMRDSVFGLMPLRIGAGMAGVQGLIARHDARSFRIGARVFGAGSEGDAGRPVNGAALRVAED